MFSFSQIKAVLFDMDGVLYRGNERLPGVHEMFTFCQERGLRYACITNNSTRTPQQYEEKLASMGIDVPAALVLTSAIATNRYLREHYPEGTTVYMLGMDGLHDQLFGDGYFVEQEREPELVVQGADFETTYAKLKAATIAIRRGARYIATNPDRTFPSEEGLIPGAGAIIAAIQAATDVAPFIVGKPEPTMFEIAVKMVESEPAATLMIGDRLDTDIAGANNAGLVSALVMTGVAAAERKNDRSVSPNVTSDDLPTLLAEWRRER